MITLYCAGYRYSFDVRFVPVWLAYVALDAYIAFYNYREALGYVGESFKKCFEESYCIAIIELVNRNWGPLMVLVCLMFGGRRHKVVALAGTERTLAFLRDTDAADWGASGAATVRLSPCVKYYSVVVIAAYMTCILMYTTTIPFRVTITYAFYSMGQTALYNLAMLQYYVLERGYARVNRLLETIDIYRDPVSARRLLARLSDVHDELGRLVDTLNRAYVLSLLFKWPYTIVRLIMIVFRIIELSAVVRIADHPFGHSAAILIVEHAAEIGLSLFQLSCFSTIGEHLSHQAGHFSVVFRAQRTLASLQKLKLSRGYHLDLETKKMITIFWVRVNARKIKANIGGYIIIDMDFIKSVCGIIATYFLVLIQFKFQKGKSKPLHHLWN
ncbi:7TM chemoreceptor [Cinara cedri]|uniref:Gustatory receptor n=1 Tax=Cinara cedri TaxID=506608 RepID=A0A5E4MET8_9HEMI|nr:7TM chemoreceptor [Cinara cedri]